MTKFHFSVCQNTDYRHLACFYAESHCTECHYAVMLNAVMASVIMLCLAYLYCRAVFHYLGAVKLSVLC